MKIWGKSHVVTCKKAVSSLNHPFLYFFVKMCQLLATRNNLMKERKILCQEVEFLRKQWMPKTPPEPVTPVMETASNASAENEDIGHTSEEKEREA